MLTRHEHLLRLGKDSAERAAQLNEDFFPSAKNQASKGTRSAQFERHRRAASPQDL